jgi:RNA polymerase sigma-70 factor (ECF subfamily)
LDLLPPKQREVVRLKFQAQLSYEEIAAITSLSVSNVGVLLHTAIRTLRQRMTQLEATTPTH